MLATEEVADESPGHGVNTISEREQDDEENHVPESTATEHEHAEPQATQDDPGSANLLFRPAIAQPPRERPDNDRTEGHQPHKEGGSGLVKALPDQERDEVYCHPGIGNIPKAVEASYQPEGRASESLFRRQFHESPGRTLVSCHAAGRGGWRLGLAIR